MIWTIGWLVVIGAMFAFKAWQWWDREQRQKAERSRGERSFGEFLLTRDSIARPHNGDYKPLSPAVHATVETAGQVRERLTATRIAALGLFALAAKKKIDEREVYLTIAGPDFEWISMLPADNGPHARSFAAAVNHAGRSRSQP